MKEDRLITVAIHTFDHALKLRAMLEEEDIRVSFQNVNLQDPVVSSGIRVRIPESDLPLALRIIEAPHIFRSSDIDRQEDSHYILVPVDFKPYSMAAAEDAIRIAAAHNADVCLLHSYIDPNEESAMQLSASLNYTGADESERKRIEDAAVTSLDEFSDKLLAKMRNGELPPAKLIKKVVEGVPEDSIVEYSKINPPLIVVMGTRACSDKESQLIGSVTAEVLDQCQNSILAIPDGYNRSNASCIERVVFFSNLEQADLLAIDSLCRIFSENTPLITLVHIPGKKRNIFMRTVEHSLDSILSYCCEHYPRCSFEKATVDLTEINTDSKLWDDVVKRYNPDLIVIPNKRKNAFTRLFSPSLAHRLLFFSTEAPILAIPV